MKVVSRSTKPSAKVVKKVTFSGTPRVGGRNTSIMVKKVTILEVSALPRGVPLKIDETLDSG